MHRAKFILVVVGIWFGCVVSGLFVGGGIGLLAGTLDIPHPDGPGDGLGIMCACAGGAFLGMIIGGFVANKATALYTKRCCLLPVNALPDGLVWPPPPNRDNER